MLEQSQQVTGKGLCVKIHYSLAKDLPSKVKGWHNFNQLKQSHATLVTVAE